MSRRLARSRAPFLGSALLLPLLLGGLSAGCRSTRLYEPSPGAYDAVPEAWLPKLERSRAAMVSGQYSVAQDLLRPLTIERPDLMPVRILFQEAELAGLARARARPTELPSTGIEPPPEADPEDVEGVRSALSEFYRRRAETTGTAADYALAARLASDGDHALELLGVAAGLDADCVWVHYGAAWWLVRMRRFPEAREAIERAFALDGGHMPTMRLHASLQARAGEALEAIECLELWLERGREDAFIDPPQRAEAQVDLAALFVQEGRPERALVILSGVRRGDLLDPFRMDLLEAVAFEDLGRSAQALAAAKRARTSSPDPLLALVHQGLLYEAQGQAELEEASWRELIDELQARSEEAGGAGAAEGNTGSHELAWLPVRVQALARLGRLERRRAARRPPRAPDTTQLEPASEKTVQP